MAASLHGEYQLADVLAGEQPGQRVREGANASLEDVFAGDQPPLAQPAGQLGPGLGTAVGVVGG
jgi:hypothetical protein